MHQGGSAARQVTWLDQQVVCMHTQTQAQGLQLLDINLSVLDSLVLEYLTAEDFVEVSSCFTPKSVEAACCTA